MGFGKENCDGASRVSLPRPGGAEGRHGPATLDSLPAARPRFDEAAEVLGYSLADVCFNGPAERLNSTAVSQPALFVASLAALEALRTTEPDAEKECVATAGLSLGEYTALTFAGAPIPRWFARGPAPRPGHAGRGRCHPRRYGFHHRPRSGRRRGTVRRSSQGGSPPGCQLAVSRQHRRFGGATGVRGGGETGRRQGAARCGWPSPAPSTRL